MLDRMVRLSYYDNVIQKTDKVRTKLSCECQLDIKLAGTLNIS